MLIRQLSGGQVKRASLANELRSRPGLLFLDEVTSDLDEQTDREVMELFREVADGGKTVVCVTHSLAKLQWLTLASLATAGTAVGLTISALARSEEVATALIPIVVTPQIILAGAVAPLSGIAQALAKGLVTVYWGREGLERLLPRADLSLIGRGKTTGRSLLK